MSQTKTTWYVEPKPGHTATTIGREVSGENECRQVVCADGKKHDLYRMESWAEVKRLLDSAQEHQLKFKVLKQEGKRPPQLFNPEKVFSRKSDEVKRVAEQLAHITGSKAARS
ncbi:MAG: hypothetical protein AAB458_02725 [Patescibacteria group bacterium]